MKIIVILLFGLFIAPKLFAQDNELAEALSLFQTGAYAQVIQKLENHEFANSGQKNEALYLLATTHGKMQSYDLAAK